MRDFIRVYETVPESRNRATWATAGIPHSRNFGFAVYASAVEGALGSRNVSSRQGVGGGAGKAPANCTGCCI